MSTPLSIGLGIDFQELDNQLGKVADKIENVGKSVSLKVGSLAGLASKGDLGTDEIQSQVARIGVELSQSMAGGVRTSSALMLAFGARINSMLDRLTGTAITMFDRIDNAMKFPKWDAAISRLHVGLANFWKTGTAGMSGLDVAMKGGFGKIAQTAARVLQPLFADLGRLIGVEVSKGIASLIPEVQKAAREIAASMKAAADSMAGSMSTAIAAISGQFKGMGMVIRSTEADAAALMGTFRDMGKYQKFAKFPEARARRPIAGLPTDIGGTEAAREHMMAGRPAAFQGPPVPPPPRFASGLGGSGVQLKADIGEAIAQYKQLYAIIARSPAGMGLGLVIQNVKELTMFTLRTGAAFLDFGAVATRAIGRVWNFVSSFGNIHKQTFSSMFADHGVFVGSLLSVTKVVQHLARGLWDIATLRAFRRVGDDAQRLGGSIRTTTGLVGTLGKSFGRLGVEMTAALGFIGVGYKLVQFFTGGIKAAGELETATTRSKIVFADFSGSVQSQMAGLAPAAGATKGEMFDLASSFGSIAQGAGMGEAASASFATKMTKMAADLAVRVGISMEEAGDSIKSGLVGRGMELKGLGVVMDEATVKSYALASGLGAAAAGGMGKAGGGLKSVPAKGGKGMFATPEEPGKAKSAGHQKLSTDISKQTEVMARAALISRGLWFAQGAASDAAGTASAQFRKAGGGIKLFAETIGSALLPAITAGTTGFNALLGGVLDMVDRSSGAIFSWAQSASDGVNTVIAQVKAFGPTILANLTWAWEEAKKGPFSFVITAIEYIVDFGKAIPEAIGIAIRNAGTLWEIAKLEVGAFVENAIRWAETLPENFGRIWDWLGRNWFNLLTDMGNMYLLFTKNMIMNAVNFGTAIWNAIQGKPWEFAWTPLLDGFKATTEKLPEMIKPALVDVSGEVGKLYEKIGQNELQNKLKPPKAVEALGGPKKPGPLGDAAKTPEYKLASAVEVGSKEAYSIVARTQAGGMKDPAKEGVKVAKDSHETLKAIHKTLADRNERSAKAIEIK